jgi:hypothetical protein
MSDAVSLRDAMIATMERVRDEHRPGVVYWLIPQFADALLSMPELGLSDVSAPSAEYLEQDRAMYGDTGRDMR